MKIAKFSPWIGVVSCLLAMQVTANTIYLVRHAEKQDGSKDPALSACGQARAAALARYFDDIPLQAVFATPYQRTQQTAIAVATGKQLPVNSYDPAKPEPLRKQLLAYTAPVLVVGHSNTVPQLVTQLSGIEVAPLSELEYSMLYQLNLGDEIKVVLSRQAFSCGKQDNIN